MEHVIRMAQKWHGQNGTINKWHKNGTEKMAHVLRMARKWHGQNGTINKWHKNVTGKMAHAKKMAQTKWHEYNDTIKMA